MFGIKTILPSRSLINFCILLNSVSPFLIVVDLIKLSAVLFSKDKFLSINFFPRKLALTSLLPESFCASINIFIASILKLLSRIISLLFESKNFTAAFVTLSSLKFDGIVSILYFFANSDSKNVFSYSLMLISLTSFVGVTFSTGATSFIGACLFAAVNLAISLCSFLRFLIRTSTCLLDLAPSIGGTKLFLAKLTILD